VVHDMSGWWAMLEDLEGGVRNEGLMYPEVAEATAAEARASEARAAEARRRFQREEAYWLATQSASRRAPVAQWRQQDEDDEAARRH
jgi:hypothetical protein